MESYLECKDVTFRLKTAWRSDDFHGSLNRAKSALLDATRVLSPSDIQRLVSEPARRQPTAEPREGGLTPELLLRTARCCRQCAQLCDLLTYMDENDEAVRELRFPRPLLEEGTALISKLLSPKYLRVIDKIKEQVSVEDAELAQLIIVILGLIIGISQRVILPVLDSWEFFLLFENAITRIRDYLSSEPMAIAIIKAAKQRDRNTIARLISSSGTLNPRTAATFSVLSFLGKIWPPLDISPYFRNGLVFRIVAKSLKPSYFILAGGSRVLDEIGEFQVKKILEKYEHSVSFDFAQTEKEMMQYFEQLNSTLVKQQDFEIPLLQQKEEIMERCQAISLDIEVETEEGESTTSADLMPAEPDLMEAELAYYGAVSKLPDERLRRIFRRVWEEGETPQQAAINLGYEWTSALERQVERMTKKIHKEMLS